MKQFDSQAIGSAKRRSKVGNVTSKVQLPEEVTGLFHRNYDRILADDSLSDKDVILIVLYLIEHKNRRAGVKYQECKKLFIYLGRKEVPNFGVNIHNARKEKLIDQKDSTLYFLAGGLKRVAELLGQIQKAPVYVIKSGESFTAIKRLEEFLAQSISSGELLLCDPYVSSATLFPFSELSHKPKFVRLLTTQVQNSDKFRDYKKKLQTETGTIVEVRTSNKIHDRYLISGKQCWSFGASIKDLGGKDTTIREISEVTQSMKELFEERWNESASFT